MNRNLILIAITVVVFSAYFFGLACRSLYAADNIQTAGDVLMFVLPATAAGLTFGHCDSTGALQLGESLGVTLGATYALKYGINETRPNERDNHAFPSAHTSVSFSSAEFIRKRYGLIYGGPSYALATFVAYSRVESREHYIHDVAAGAAIGILSSYLFTKPYKGVDVRLETDGKYYSLNFNLKW
ncbi:MAG: phosphatase PAP2 family protein [Desulfobacterales bacterium]|nr:phosphatase PAP2 family protein [Desulfobacterales bacterium]